MDAKPNLRGAKSLHPFPVCDIIVYALKAEGCMHAVCYLGGKLRALSKHNVQTSIHLFFWIGLKEDP